MRNLFQTFRWGMLLVIAMSVFAAASQTAYPHKSIKIVVPFGAGGVADLTARIVGQKLSEQLGQSVVIENKPGAGGVVATDAVAKSAPDGYTLLLMSNATAVSAGLFKTLPFDAERDLWPVSTLGSFDIALVVPQASPFKTLQDFLAYAKTHPGQLNVGSINVGSTQHLTAELFKTAAGVNVQVVPFNGSPAVLTALRGGQIDAAVEILAPLLPQINSQALRALAVTGDKRAASLPGVPTAKESGVMGLSAASWNALAVPHKTPLDIVQKLNRDIQLVLAMPDVRKRLLDINVEPQPSTVAQASELLSAEIKRWREVIQRAGIPRQ